MKKNIIDQSQFEEYKFDKELFERTTGVDVSHDKKFDTKPISYLQDAFRRFRKNKGSVFAAIIIVILVLYALIAPYQKPQSFKDSYATNTKLVNYKTLLPRNKLFDGTGFWDGTQIIEVSKSQYDMYRGMNIESGYDAVVELIDVYKKVNPIDNTTSTKYKIRVNTYYINDNFTVTLTEEGYKDLQRFQDENQIQVCLPMIRPDAVRNGSNKIWYETKYKEVILGGTTKYTPTSNADYLPGTIDPETGVGVLIPAYQLYDGTDIYTSTMRLSSDPYNQGDIEHSYNYAQRSGKPGQFNYTVRVNSYNYFIYMYGFEPSFLFGTDNSGYDIFTRLAEGARFSFIFAICISIINLLIGTIYGAIEGYYGGVTDIVMERISDILANVPFTVVSVLFNLHLAHKVGTVPALIFAFILTGWIGMASSVRMQFYRFKNQEYILAARTLGARDSRIMFKHILPNALGTLITGCVLVIPGVIFSETSLTYLGIVNLDSATRSSIGSMLSSGQAVMNNYPHVILFPALMIALLEICFNLFGNGLRDAFNPALRGAED